MDERQRKSNSSKVSAFESWIKKPWNFWNFGTIKLMRMELKDGKKTFYAKNGKVWRTWLQKNGEKERSIWLIVYRNDAEKPSVYLCRSSGRSVMLWLD